jgi:hypothetical protein
MANKFARTCYHKWRPGKLVVLALASFLFAGIKAGAEGVPNGGFESGDLSGWALSGEGSAQVLDGTSLSALVPPEGAWFALVGNGPSDISGDGLPDSATLTSSTFNVPAGGGQLSFYWDFLTAEFTGMDADPTRLDRFSVSLLLAGGSPVTLLSGDVADAGPFTLLDAGGAAAPDGTSVFEHTGFRFSTFSVTEGMYSLAFTVSDDGDGSFDSALAVDRVAFRVGVATAVPEPASGILLIVGTAAFAALRRSGHIRKAG